MIVGDAKNVWDEVWSSSKGRRDRSIEKGTNRRKDSDEGEGVA